MRGDFNLQQIAELVPEHGVRRYPLKRGSLRDVAIPAIGVRAVQSCSDHFIYGQHAMVVILHVIGGSDQ